MAAITGLNASGTATVLAARVHRTPPVPPAASAAPTIAPVNECVVETGNPVRGASRLPDSIATLRSVPM